MEQTRIIVVGFTGPSGSGKTTLAKWLVEQNLGEEVVMHYFEGSASLTHTEEQRQYLTETYGYEPKGHQNVINLSSQNPEFGFDFQRLLAEGRQIRLNDYLDNIDDDGKIHLIITDRTFLDILTYSALQCSHNIDDERMEKLAYRCNQAQSDLFDVTFVVKPNDGWTEDNGSRVPRNYYQNNVVWPVITNVVAKYVGKGGTNTLPYLAEWDLNYRKNRVLEVLHFAIHGEQLEATANVENK